MIYYRMLKKTDPTVLKPVKAKKEEELIDLIYSNSMPSHGLRKDTRRVWSFAKTPEAALKWLGPRGKNEYDRLTYYDFCRADGMLLDITELKTWIALIELGGRNDFTIKNLNRNITIEAVISIIPCSKSAWSMAKSCEEVVFIPSRAIQLEVITDLKVIPHNSAQAESVLTELDYNDRTIDKLLEQVEKYEIRPNLKKALKELKAAKR